MLHRMCKEQSRLVEAARAGRADDPTVQAHLASCRSCREAVDVVRAMRGLAGTPGPAHALPNPSAIWWRAELVRRWAAERRAEAPIEGAHRAELVGAAVGLVAFVVWRWSALTDVVSSQTLASLVRWSAASLDAPGAWTALTVGLVLGGLLLWLVHGLLLDQQR
jgi:hypothetical protein